MASSVEYSPFADLWGILSVSPDRLIVFLLVILTPFAGSYLLKKFAKQKALATASLAAAGFTFLVSLIWLSMLGPPAGISPVGLLILPFLFLYIPIWLILTCFTWLLLRRLIRSEDAS